MDTKALISNEIDRVRHALSSAGSAPLEYTAEALSAIVGGLEGLSAGGVRMVAARVITVWDRRGLPPPAIWLRVAEGEALREKDSKRIRSGCGLCLQGALYYLGRTRVGVYEFVCACECEAGRENVGGESWRVVVDRGRGEVSRKDFAGTWEGLKRLRAAHLAMIRAEREREEAPVEVEAALPADSALDLPF